MTVTAGPDAAHSTSVVLCHRSAAQVESTSRIPPNGVRKRLCFRTPQHGMTATGRDVPSAPNTLAESVVEGHCELSSKECLAVAVAIPVMVLEFSIRPTPKYPQSINGIGDARAKLPCFFNSRKGYGLSLVRQFLTAAYREAGLYISPVDSGLPTTYGDFVGSRHKDVISSFAYGTEAARAE